MRFVLDSTYSIEFSYNAKQETYTRKIRKNGIVVDIFVIDKKDAEKYFRNGELEMFQRYLEGEHAINKGKVKEGDQ